MIITAKSESLNGYVLITITCPIGPFTAPTTEGDAKEFKVGETIEFLEGTNDLPIRFTHRCICEEIPKLTGNQLCAWMYEQFPSTKLHPIDHFLKDADKELLQAKSEINSPASDALIDCVEHVLQALKIIRASL